MRGKMFGTQEHFNLRVFFKKIWKFLLRPFKHEILVLFFLFLSTAYFFAGFSLVSRPSLVLYGSRSPGLEAEANIFLKSRGIHCVNTPRVYILTKGARMIFYWPYVFAFRRMIDVRYPAQISQSYPRVEDNAIVMQEEEMNDRWVFAHEVGHFAQLCVDPEGFARQIQIQRERFADDFQASIQSTFQSKTRPLH